MTNSYRAKDDTPFLTKQIRKVLSRGALAFFVPTKCEWPNMTYYRDWCSIPHEHLLQFLRGTRRLEPEMLERLAFLTGSCPMASDAERRARIVDADFWMHHEEMHGRFDGEILNYLHARYAARTQNRQPSTADPVSEASIECDLDGSMINQDGKPGPSKADRGNAEYLAFLQELESLPDPPPRAGPRT